MRQYAIRITETDPIDPLREPVSYGEVFMIDGLERFRDRNTLRMILVERFDQMIRQIQQEPAFERMAPAEQTRGTTSHTNW